MVNYGFCLEDNLYNSHVIHLRLDVSLTDQADVKTLFAKNVSGNAGEILQFVVNTKQYGDG